MSMYRSYLHLGCLKRSELLSLKYYLKCYCYVVKIQILLNQKFKIYCSNSIPMFEPETTCSRGNLRQVIQSSLAWICCKFLNYVLSFEKLFYFVTSVKLKQPSSCRNYERDYLIIRIPEGLQNWNQGEKERERERDGERESEGESEREKGLKIETL